MTEAEWLSSSRPHDLFQTVVRRREGAKREHRRKCILAACACCRNVQVEGQHPNTEYQQFNG